MPTLRALATLYEPQLEAAGVYNPRADLRTLIMRAFAIDAEKLDVYWNDEVTDDAKARLDELVTARAKRIPIGRIFGSCVFRDLQLQLDEGVFEPSPEAGTLVDYALLELESRGGGKHLGQFRLLDLGCGSGALLLSLLHDLPNSTGMGVDINSKAVTLAARNATQNQLTFRATFQVDNWARSVQEKFDVIISNPPHVLTDRISRLMPEVQKYEPREALDGGKDGLNAYRDILQEFVRLAKPDGVGVFLTNMHIAAPALRLCRETFPNAELRNNYLGVPVCLFIRRRDYQPRAARGWLQKLLGRF